jgi:hypothetical protein
MSDCLRIAFLTGCARSGTSILGEVLGAHAGVEYRHEAHHIWAKARPEPQGSHQLTQAAATPEVARDLRRRLRPERADALLIEKNPRSMLRVPFIRVVFPEARFIHIVRDGRDVACSLMPGVGGAEWRHLKPANWQALFAEQQGISRCAWLWRTALEVALTDLEGVPHLTVRYEDLVRDPEEVSGEILAFLGLTVDGGVRDFCSRVQDKARDSYQPAKQRKWSRDDHEFRIGRWRKNLTEEEARTVERIEQDMLERFGYALAFARTAP